MKRSKKETINEWLRVRHQLIIRNEENFEEKTTIVYNNAKAIVIGFIIFLVLFFLGVSAQKYLFYNWNAGNEDIIQKRMVIQLSEQVDSLSYTIDQKDQFIRSFKTLLDPTFEQTVVDADSNTVALSDQELQKLKKADKALRTEFETKVDNFSVKEYNEYLFFSPVKNLGISKKFNLSERHYGIDILTEENHPVLAVTEGIVIFAEWSINSGHCLAIQHSDNLVSIYKHCSVLLKEKGDIISQGDVIGIVGNSGEQTTGSHLHFEIWENKQAVNPINFLIL